MKDILAKREIVGQIWLHRWINEHFFSNKFEWSVGVDYTRMSIVHRYPTCTIILMFDGL